MGLTQQVNTLEVEKFPWMVEKGRQRESKHKEDLTYCGWLEHWGSRAYDKDFEQLLEV